MHLKKMLGAVIASALLFTMPVPSAHADTYAPDAVNQDFAGSQGGWTSSTASDGLCLPVLLCPVVSNGWSAGGADGNGYIQTSFTTLLTTGAGFSTGMWESPSFAYNGNAGKVPGAVRLDLNMMTDVTPLLVASLLNSASYRVDLVDQATSTAVEATPTTPITSDHGWTAVQSASVNPALLQLGHQYKIRITTTLTSAVAAVANGSVGYDNVRLTTEAANGNGGGNGANGGSGITDIKQLRKLVKTYILPGTMKVQGRFLKARLRCPAIASPRACQIQLQGLQKGRFSKPATARKVVKIKAGKQRTVKIRIKPAYVAKYSKSKKIWVKCIVRVGKVRVAVRQPVKLK
ncbi:hypothetical protein [Nocardioides halotolerans]|uniref:hypothetical protein n=1 Tax=Nocardioides halotolerans TaxID=433660 RepID=UPI00040A8DC2|nr:hypothetical protein [Nocardioides halotolerans]